MRRQWNKTKEEYDEANFALCAELRKIMPNVSGCYRFKFEPLFQLEPLELSTAT